MLALGRLLSVISTLTFLWMVYEGTLTLNIITSDTSPTVQAGKPMIVHGDDPAPLSNSEGGAFSSRPFPAP
jgi:hypothetical protein